MPEEKNQYLHEVVITAIVYKDDRYLIMAALSEQEAVSRHVDGSGREA